jgi:hypothetical protein
MHTNMQNTRDIYHAHPSRLGGTARPTGVAVPPARIGSHRSQ